MSSLPLSTHLCDALYQKRNNTNFYIDSILSSLSLSFPSVSVSVDMMMLTTKRVFLGRTTCLYNSIDNGGYGIKTLQDVRHRLYHVATKDQMDIDRNIIEIYSKNGHLTSERILLTMDSFNDLTIDYVLFGKSYSLHSHSHLYLGHVCKLFYMINNTNDSIIICTSFLLTLLLSTTSSINENMIYNEWILLQLVILHVNYAYEMCSYDDNDYQYRLHISSLCLNKVTFFAKFIHSYIQSKGYHDYNNYSTNAMIEMISESIATLLTNDNTIAETIETLLSYMIN